MSYSDVFDIRQGNRSSPWRPAGLSSSTEDLVSSDYASGDQGKPRDRRGIHNVRGAQKRFLVC
jgi:hypothetical protein